MPQHAKYITKNNKAENILFILPPMSHHWQLFFLPFLQPFWQDFYNSPYHYIRLMPYNNMDNIDLSQSLFHYNTPDQMSARTIYSEAVQAIYILS